MAETTPQAAGDLALTNYYDEGRHIGVWLDRADPTVQFSCAFMRSIASCAGPVASLVDGVLTIQAVNGIWSYRLRAGWGDEDGPLTVLGDLIEVQHA